MDDMEIIKLFFARSDSAVGELDGKQAHCGQHSAQQRGHGGMRKRHISYGVEHHPAEGAASAVPLHRRGSAESRFQPLFLQSCGEAQLFVPGDRERD